MAPSILNRKLVRILTLQFRSKSSVGPRHETTSSPLETVQNGNKVPNKLPLYSVAFDPKHQQKCAFTDYRGDNFTYEQLARKTISVSNELRRTVEQHHGADVHRGVVGIMCPQDSTFLISLWGCWMAGHTALPLSDKHPENLLEYFVQTCQSKVVLTTSQYVDKLNPVAKKVGFEVVVLDFDRLPKIPDISSTNFRPRDSNEDALILFTSGTTGLPKGVLLTHNNLAAQVGNICTAFDITSKDTLLHVLPLHHTHGLIHALLSPLSVGARCRMLKKFDAATVWETLLSSEEARPNVFMGVPTVYVKLLEEYDKTVGMGPPGQAQFVKNTCSEKMRLMLSGSASLPVPVIEKWESVTGHRILERYGMTEIGVALSNSLKGKRRPGFVGTPFPSVEISVVDMTSGQDTVTVVARGDSTQTQVLVDQNQKDDNAVIGELLVKGPSVFKGYWNNPEGTRKEFTEGGWFITGDTVEFVDGAYRILGRRSVDIIKSGGYKLSALEIEAQLLALDEIKEIAILGLDDPVWGQKVAAIVVWEDSKEMSLAEFSQLAKKCVAPYACPRVIKTMKELPRNHLGKVNKKELAKIFETLPNT